jgi:cytoskeletal protein CcmA (bactofilin family)
LYTQQRSEPSETEDSSGIVKQRIDTLVDDILSSINNEIQMTLGRDSDHRSRHSHYESDLSDSARMHDEFVIDGDDSTITFTGDALIGINDTIRGSVLVRPGSLTVNGVVEGNVTVYDGNIVVNRGGIITGDATAVRGKITKNEGGIVGGVMYETSEDPDEYASDDHPFHLHHSHAEKYRHRDREHRLPFPQYTLNWLTNSVSNFDPLILRYNRVDGLFLGVGKSEIQPWETRNNHGFYGSLGYGFALHRWRYSMGMDVFPGVRDRLEAGIEYHDITDTRDSWIMNRNENSAAAFFIHEDFYDYFGRRGFSVHGSVYPSHQIRARIDYLTDEYQSLPWKTDWALFGGTKHFRPNPSITDGLMRSLILSLDYSTIDHGWWERSGWNLHASAEYAGDSYGGDFAFNRYLLDVRRYQRVSDYSKLSTRIRVGSSYGILPYQKLFEFGGIGTLNAYPYKELFGNRMVLANVEYLIHGSTFDESDFWPLEILSPFSLALFLDAGWATYVPARFSYSDGFNSLSWNTLKSDIGFGIGSRDGTLRVAWAWRTDQRSAPVFFFRISRPF